MSWGWGAKSPTVERLLFSQVSNYVLLPLENCSFVFSPIQLKLGMLRLQDIVVTYFALLRIVHIFHSEHALLLVIGGKLNEIYNTPPFLKSTYTSK